MVYHYSFPLSAYGMGMAYLFLMPMVVFSSHCWHIWFPWLVQDYKFILLVLGTDDMYFPNYITASPNTLLCDNALLRYNA
jgi:hypothetical protein